MGALLSAQHLMSDSLPLASRRVLWLKVMVAGGLLAAMLLSHRLWVSTRSYPLSPVFRLLRPVPFPFDYAVYVALLAFLALILVARKPARPIAAFVSLAAIWALFDQSRWQPWFYQYLFMLAALGLWFSSKSDARKREAALDACRLIVVCIYLWSGIQKINPGFLRGTFFWMLEPLTGTLPAAAKVWLQPLAFVAPFFEAAIAVGLLTRKFRNLAVLAAIATHVFILASIGPLGRDYNDVVWPWNVAMAASVGLLFWRAEGVRASDVLWNRDLAFQKLVLVLFALAPALSLFNRWDNYLSFALYSGNRNSAVLYMTAPVAKRLPEGVQELMTDDESQAQDGSKPDELAIADWSWDDLNVPPYPEVRVFKNIGRVICREASGPSDVKLVVDGRTTWFGPSRRSVYDCASLRN